MLRNGVEPIIVTIYDLQKNSNGDYLFGILKIVYVQALNLVSALSLKWSRVNLENDFIIINADDAESEKYRHIPLNREAKAVLTNWQKDVVTPKSATAFTKLVCVPR